jgi:hypothetical protein
MVGGRLGQRIREVEQAAELEGVADGLLEFLAPVFEGAGLDCAAAAVGDDAALALWREIGRRADGGLLVG